MIFFENIELFIVILIVVLIASVSLVLAITSYNSYSALKRKYDLFMSGRDAESLEQYFLDIQSDIDHLIEDSEKQRESIRKLNRITKRTFQKSGLYKYDAFGEKSGKKSFALCLLDYVNTGFVLTVQSMSSGSVTIFIKKVEVGATSVKLGPEEEKAVEMALGQKTITT